MRLPDTEAGLREYDKKLKAVHSELIGVRAALRVLDDVSEDSTYHDFRFALSGLKSAGEQVAAQREKAALALGKLILGIKP